VSTNGWSGADQAAKPGLELVGPLGRGARTVVYRARRGDREYAVKLLRSAGVEADAAAFVREGALLAALDHPGLVRIHEVGAAGRPAPALRDVAMEVERLGQEPERVGGVRDALEDDVGHAELLVAAHRRREFRGRSGQRIVEVPRPFGLEVGKPETDQRRDVDRRRSRPTSRHAASILANGSAMVVGAPM
jgi:hypothetical protein